MGMALLARACAAMSWFRRHVRFGSWCAVFALAFQLALSFGHFHFRDDGSRSAASLVFEPGSAQTSAALPDAPAAPSKQTRLAFDFCAICAVSQLAGSLLPSAAPALPLPLVGQSRRLEPGVELILAAFPYLLFRARAPPVS